MHATHHNSAQNQLHSNYCLLADAFRKVCVKRAHPVRILPSKVVEALNFYYCAAAAAAKILGCITCGVWRSLEDPAWGPAT